jgi:hypothetical protein
MDLQLPHLSPPPSAEARFLSTVERVVGWLLRPTAPPADVRAAYVAAHLSRSCTSTLVVQTVAEAKRANNNYVARLLPSLWATLGTTCKDHEGPLGPGATTPRDLAVQTDGVAIISHLTEWISGTGSLTQARALWDCEPRATAVAPVQIGPHRDLEPRPAALGPVQMGPLARLLYYECFRLGEVSPTLILGLIDALGAYRALVADRDNPPSAFSSLPVGLILLAHVMLFPTLGPHAIRVRRAACNCIRPQRDWFDGIPALPIDERSAYRRDGVDRTPCPYEAWGFNSPMARTGGRPLRGWDASSGCLDYLVQARRLGRLNVLDIQIAEEYANVLVQPLRWAGPGDLAPRA